MKFSLTFTQPASKFRKDIEGLRGLAVLLVMLYHFKAPYISGGYIGVDIFFVISGFLISSIIFNALGKQDFKLSEFYNRRAKRLMPGLLFACIVSLILFSAILLPSDYTLYLRSLREIFLFNSNSFFLKETQDYFSPISESMPLLHTWSLSLEWQFYLAFPAFILAVNKFFGKTKIAYAVSALTLVLILISAYLTPNNPSAYFSFLPRFFEFTIGASAAFITFKSPIIFEVIFRYALILLLIILSILYNSNTQFPGLPALLVCLLAFLFLVSANSSKILNNNIITSIGKISYSAYLFHWFFVVLALNLNIQLETLWFIPLTLTLVIAYASYYWVENPLRHIKTSLPKTIFWLIFLPLIISLALVYIARKHDGLPQRLGNQFTYAYETVKASNNPQRHHCHGKYNIDIQECQFGDSQGEQKGLLIGDSHASHFWETINILAKDAGIKMHGLTSSSCFTSPDILQISNATPKQECINYLSRVLPIIESGDFDFVIISQRWAGYKDTLSITNSTGKVEAISTGEATKRLLDMIFSVGSKPILILPIAENNKDLSRCFYRALKQSKNLLTCNIMEKDKPDTSALFSQILEAHPSTLLLDPSLVQCQAGECLTSINGVPFYSDFHHINDYAAKWLALGFIDRKLNPFRPDDPE